MNLNDTLSKLDDYSIDQIKTLKFNLDHDVFFTYVLQPNLHDTLIEACNIKLMELSK
jgi:hypothetical protein